MQLSLSPHYPLTGVLLYVVRFVKGAQVPTSPQTSAQLLYKWLHCLSEGPQQAGETDWQDNPEVQRKI